MNKNSRVLVSQNGRMFFVKDNSKDFHTQYGFLSKSELEKADGEVIRSNTGKEFSIFEPSFIDFYRKISRGPQIVPLKDLGLIISNTGIQKDWKVIDSGAGNGGVCLYLATIVKKVITYEIRDDFAGIVKKNMENLGITNLTLKLKNIYEGIREKNVDLITLDLPEPWKVIPHAEKALKPGGFLVSYSPSVPQVSDFSEELRKHRAFMKLKVIEVTEREWDVQGRIIRPKTSPVGHSGFITFARKIRKD